MAKYYIVRTAAVPGMKDEMGGGGIHADSPLAPSLHGSEHHNDLWPSRGKRLEILKTQ